MLLFTVDDFGPSTTLLEQFELPFVAGKVRAVLTELTGDTGRRDMQLPGRANDILENTEGVGERWRSPDTSWASSACLWRSCNTSSLARYCSTWCAGICNFLHKFSNNCKPGKYEAMFKIKLTGQETKTIGLIGEEVQTWNIFRVVVVGLEAQIKCFGRISSSSHGRCH